VPLLKARRRMGLWTTYCTVMTPWKTVNWSRTFLPLESTQLDSQREIRKLQLRPSARASAMASIARRAPGPGLKAHRR